ncbi:MAG: helicase-related protein [archaeon]
MPEFVELPFIKKNTLEKRKYQMNILELIKGKNSLVILPTGLGKTAIAALVASTVLPKKVLVVAPTRPLSVQHYEFFKKVMDLPEDQICLLTGKTNKKERVRIWGNAKIICATPQTVINDFNKKIADFSDFELLVVDECHRATKKYAYVPIIKNFPGKVLGLTASPSYSLETIVKNLGAEKIEIYTEDHPDVAPYVFAKEIKKIQVNLPEKYKEISEKIKEIIKRIWEKFGEMNVKISKRRRDILEYQKWAIENKFYPGIVLSSALIKAYYSLDMLESQGVDAFLSYTSKLINDQSKSSKFLVKLGLKNAYEMAKDMEKHPKYKALLEILEKERGKQGIIFAQYRDTVEKIVDFLSGHVRAVKFVGQAGEDGLSQKEQQEIISDFKAGKHDVLCATSVAEEGLDIPSVDYVVFFEPVPSDIRKIQREGRTGRHKIGKIYVLMAKKTIDEANFWSSRAKYKKMLSKVKEFKKEPIGLEKWLNG